MRLPVKNPCQGFGARRALRGLATIALAGSLAGCAILSGDDAGARAAASAAALPSNGPQADYPLLVGEPYRIGDTIHTPVDTMNYDEVGYLAEDSGAMGITGSHHTLPVPSYAEVTSLTTGRTILVRLERRGPMNSNHLLALSPAALAQLGATPETPVRVRRVNPPEEQRMVLRNGASAPLRMDTPMGLVTVLRRRLPAAPGASAMPVQVAEAPPAAAARPAARPPAARAPAAAPPAAAPPPAARTPAAAPSARPAPATPAPASAGPPPLPPLDGVAPVPVVAAPPHPSAPPPAPPAPAPTAQSGFVVQAGAFSEEARARRVASAVGGSVTRAGNVYRVRTGPFPTRAAAEASLANVRAAGYSDARILTGG